MIAITFLDVNTNECSPAEGMQECLKLINDPEVRVLDVGDDEEVVLCFMVQLNTREREKELANIVYSEYRNIKIGTDSFLDEYFDSTQDVFDIPYEVAMELLKEVL